MRGLHRHLTYANVMATVAVFIALAGTTAAAGLKSHAPPGVATMELYPATVTGAEVKGEGPKTATASCGPIKVAIAGSYHATGGLSHPTIKVDYAERKVVVSTTLLRINGKPNSTIQAVADCIGVRNL
jgi:hypothetical protein